MTLSTTICIPTTFERSEYLLLLINSILNQTKKPSKILFVTNKGQLKKKEYLIKQIKNKISNFCHYEFIESTKSGLANARNYGIDNCNTELLFFSDDDDIWSPFKLEKINQLIEKEGKCLVTHDFNSIVKNNIEEMSFKYKFKPGSFFTGFSNFYGGGSSFCGSLCIFQTLRFNDYSVCEDWDFWIRAFISEVKIKKIKEALVSYRVHPNRMTNKNYLSSFKIQASIRITIMSKLISFVFGVFIGLIFNFLKNLSLSIYELRKTF